MKRRPLHSSDGEGFLRALWDGLADIEAEYQVELLFTISRTKRRGVFRFRLAALGVGDDPDAVLRALYIGEYPTAAIATLEAFLYRCGLKLEHILEQQRRYPEGKA